MATKKFTIIDEHGEDIGHILIKLPEKSTFESMTAAPIQISGPIADATLFVTVLAGFTAVPWLFGAPGWVSALCGVGVTSILAGIKAWRGGGLVNRDSTGEEITIKVESWQDDGHVLLDEIRDKTISMDDWRKVAKAIIVNGHNFSRPALSGVVSQTTYHKIKDEFTRLNFAHRSGNNYILSLRAIAFLKKINNLPY